MNEVHILNGDALKNKFPPNLKGEVIVARECLVDGDISGDDLEEFFTTRAKFLSKNYKGIAEQDYYDQTVPELKKIMSVPNGSEINLWFEDDLFCQVNFWFVLDLLSKSSHINKCFLIRPEHQDQYGFGGMNPGSLLSAYNNRIELTNLDSLSSLWKSYKTNNIPKLKSLALEFRSNYPFIKNAVEAHLDRIPSKGKLGRPSESLIQIIKELDTNEFGIVFKEFNKRESIYGFGDLQVKRLLDELLK